MLGDLERGKGQLRIKMTDMDAFKLGENIAVSPGKVVYQNELMQLLQYAPRTDEVYAMPLLIVPPWINKFYILDLKPENSFIRWAVAKGYTVFVVSWVNPDKKLAKKTFEDYMREGIFAALDAVEKATGQKQVNAVGYCIAGTLLSATLAYIAASGEYKDRVKSATFFAAQVDFSEAGDLLVFVDEPQLQAMEQQMTAEREKRAAILRSEGEREAQINSARGRAEALVLVSNGQWLRGTGGVQAQRQSLGSWGALFGLPVVQALNE